MPKYNWTTNQVKAYFRQNPNVMNGLVRQDLYRYQRLTEGGAFKTDFDNLAARIRNEGRKNPGMKNKSDNEMLSFDMVAPNLKVGVTETDWGRLSQDETRKQYWSKIMAPFPLSNMYDAMTDVNLKSVNERLANKALPLSDTEEKLIKNIHKGVEENYAQASTNWEKAKNPRNIPFGESMLFSLTVFGSEGGAKTPLRDVNLAKSWEPSSYSKNLPLFEELHTAIRQRKRQKQLEETQKTEKLENEIVRISDELVAERAKTEALRNANEQATRQTRAETNERLASLQRALESQPNAIANTNAGASQQQTRGYQPQIRTQDGVVKLYQDRIRRRLNLAPSRIVLGDTDTATPELYLTLLKTQGARSKK